MSISQITNHIERVILKLATQFRNKTTDQAFVGVFAAQIQVLEDALYTLLGYWDVSIAEGVHLDTLGAYYFEYREGDSDAAYRVRVVAKKQALYGGASLANVLTVADALGLDVHVYPTDHGGVSGCYTVAVDTEAATPQQAVQWLRIFKTCKPAGVRINLNFVTEDTVTGGLLTFDTGPGFDDGYMGQSLQ